MTAALEPSSDTTTQVAPREPYRPGSVEVLVVILLSTLVLQRWASGHLTSDAIRMAGTIFLAIIVQAAPFLALGVVLSGAIAAFVPTSFWQRVLPSRAVLAVPVAGLAGAVLPGCECASVPVSSGLMARGVPPAAALAFLLSAPAINPVVLVSTAVAFPHRPMMVLARFVASLLTSVAMGWLWLRFGRPEWLRISRRDHLLGSNSWQTFRLTATHDFLHAGGFLVIGGITAAVLNVAVPRSWIQMVASWPGLEVVALALLAVVLAVCSEADAFVAASLTGFSYTARLAFLVVGPMVDIKLIAMQSGTFGRRFAIRFAPTTFVVGVLASVLVGWWLL